MPSTEAHLAQKRNVCGQLDLSGKDLTDETFALIVRQLRHDALVTTIRALDLSDNAITAEGLSHLRGMQLESLRLFGTQPKDKGLASLSEMFSLRRLDLGCTRTTDEGLSNLKDLSLHSVFLNYTQVTDAGMIHFNGMPLTEANLDDTDVQGEGLIHLRQATSLSLASTEVTDSGLAAIASIPFLRHLNLSNTKVSDAGLRQIERLPLGTLDLRFTMISTEAVLSLRDSLPDTEILWCPKRNATI